MNERIPAARSSVGPSTLPSFPPFAGRAHRASGSLLGALLLCSLCSGTTLAAAVADQVDPYEVAGPEWAAPTRWNLSPAAQDAAARRAEAAGIPSSALLGAPGVSALVADVARRGLDDIAIPPHRSTSVGIASARALVDPASASLEVARAHPALVGVEDRDLAIAAVKQGGGITYVHFRQLFEGLPVLGSHILFQWDDRGRLRLTGSEVFRSDPLSLESGVSSARPAPHWISLADARIAALDGMPADLVVADWESAEQVWFPIDTGEPDYGVAREDPGFELVPVWNIRFQSEVPVGRYDVLVDGETGAVLSRTNRIQFEEFTGRVDGSIEANQPGDLPGDLGMPEIRYLLRNATTDRSGVTERDGTFRVDVPPGTYQFGAALAGDRIIVKNARAGFATPTDSAQVTLPDPANDPDVLRFFWGLENSLESDRDAYYHGNTAYQAIRAIDPSLGLIELDVPMQTVVDDPTGTCNAYWNGTRMNFYAEGGGCNATARIADVVYHEYGHAVTEFTYAPFFATGRMHEGFSDYFAATIRNDPVIGLGFFGRGTLLRNIEPDRVYPDDLVGEVHIDGLIIAGALWDLRKEIGKETTDRLWHFARYAGARTFDDFLVDMLVLDDDDVDLTNGTPHFDAIIGNFRAHGIGDYAIDLSRAILPDVEIAGAVIPVSVRIFSLVPIDPLGAALFYSVDEALSFERAELRPGNVTGEWVTELPVPPAGSTVDYYWSFTNALGDVSIAPENAPAATYSFYVGKDEVAPLIVHVEPTAVAENAERIHLRAQVADNSQRLGAVRIEYRVGNGAIQTVPMTIRDVRGLTQPQGVGTFAYGPFHEFEATLVLPDITGVDRVEYRIVADDQAQTRNTGSAPLEGFFRVPVRRGWAGDFETEPGPLDATGDWEWGEAGPGLSWSGTHVWATNLDGPYRDDVISILTLGPFDLTDYDRARFQFRSRYRFEENFDGGDIQIRVGSEGIWAPLVPEGGYSFRHVDALDGPGYSGDNEEWQRVLVPLDFYLGKEIWIRLRAGSDVGVAELGWYLDDLALLEAQAYTDPKDVAAVSGLDERVELSWRTAAGIDLSAARWLGFHVYRRKLGQERDEEIRLTSSPLRTLRYVDESGLTNATTYIYRLTNVYDDGESRGAEVQARPFAATVSLDVNSIGMVVSGYVPVSRTFGVRNQGSGFLDFDIVLADSGKPLGETLARYAVTGEPGEPTVVLLDPSEGDATVDVSAIRVEEWISDGIPMFRFIIDGEWTDPHTQWGGILVFDVDENLATSQGSLELPWGGMTNMGYEFGILFGNLPSQVGFPDPKAEAIFFDADRSSFPEIVTDAVLEQGAPIAFGIPKAWLGNPSTLRMQLLTGPSADRPAADLVPDVPLVTQWIRRAPRHGRVSGNTTGRVDVVFDATHLPSGTYRADLVVLSNDRAASEVRVPITVQVDRTSPPPSLFFQSIVPTVTGMEIRFVPSPAMAVATVGIEREEPDGSWRRLDREPLLPDGDGVYSYRDRFVREQTTYRYRIPISFENGTDRSYGPLEAIYAPDGTPQTFPAELSTLAIGSNSEGMELSFFLPEVFDPLVGVWLGRRSIGTEEFGELLEEPLLPSEDREIRYLDPWATPFNEGIEPDGEYEYRIRVELPEDTVEYYQAGRFVVPMPTELRLLMPRPNPFRSQVVVRYDLPSPLDVRLEVFDVSGRRRAVLEDGPRIAGTHQIVWDGRDAGGDPLGSGVYWMRLATNAGSRIVRMLRMR